MDVLKILPPLMIGEKEVDLFVNALDATLSECRKFPGPMWEIGKISSGTPCAQRGTTSNAQRSTLNVSSRSGAKVSTLIWTLDVELER